MAIYDPTEQRLAVRVVYDGVAMAGKTTNLRQLCTLFVAQRNTELYSPADFNGRTLYFDWMQIMAGVVSSFPLICQLVSVPGQVVLTPRRRHLLATADVVVYVCESHESAVAGARKGLELYDEVSRERGAPIPLVVQANKQDQVGALDGATLLRALGREGTPVMEGIASEGVGVVDTFVAAVRTVSRAIKEQNEAGVVRVPVRRADTASSVLSRLAAEELDPAWAAEMLLEEAQAALLLEEAMASIENDRHARDVAARAAEDLTQGSDERSGVPTARGGAVSPPSPPSQDVPTGYIWPAHTGRTTVRSLGLAEAVPAPVDEHGVVRHVAHGFVACTSTRARFADGEEGRQALVRTAREYTQLERLVPPEMVLVAQPATDGSCWIWVVRPDIPTIEALLTRGEASPALLASYGVAVVEVLRASLRQGFSVDFSPASFGVQDTNLRYVGGVSPAPASEDGVATSIFAAVEAIERAGADIGAFLEAFERELQRRLTAEERVRATVAVTRPKRAGGSAGERLYEVLSKAHEAS